MIKLIYILLFVSISNACPLQKLQCEDLRTQKECQSTMIKLSTCQWDITTKKCYVDSAQCEYNTNKEDCQRRGCKWDEQCKRYSYVEPVYRSCEENLTYYQCVSRGYNSDCSWEHNKCIPINKCSDANEIHKCRGIHLKERCVVVRNGKPDLIENNWTNLLPQIFEDIQCRALDCVYKYYENDCPSFANGRRCFKSKGGDCTQCSYLTSKKDCIQSNECTWQGGCRNSLCSDLTTKTLCSSKPYCIFNEKGLSCETRTEDKLYCYYYDIGSDPKKMTQRDL